MEADQKVEIDLEFVADLFERCGSYTSPQGWTFEVKRWGTRFSLTAGRGKRGKKVRVGEARTLDSMTIVCSVSTTDATRRLLLRLLQITSEAEAEAAHADYCAELERLGIKSYMIPSMSWEECRGIDLIDHARPELVCGSGDVRLVCSTLTFSITDQRRGLRSIPAIGLSKPKQAGALYRELERLTPDARAALTRADVDQLLKAAGVTPYTYCID